ncbi:glycosyltransferase family 2 protein [Alloacidobacterium sp.]|uniref:glycosyltransferase family 2 protein n=1 Tax=Alloacidobacterium sp. TaxID=2951999 RepID=UPI002D645EBF|nr:glycosyltransferase [Alloacidobacterium sp.]HYK36742.1 glycosyltransferase [Alloacidobacterium sp.]
MTNLLTIGLPVFNAMPFLEESMESLLGQTDRDFAILAIDDGSIDSSLGYLRSIRDPRLTVVTQAHRGLTFTLNRMLCEVTTPWLMRHDADDVALPERVAITKKAIRQFPDAGMFYSEARYYQNGRSIGTFRTTRATPDQLRQITSRGYLPAICHPTVTLNVEKATALGGYRFDLHIEDIDLWWRMALCHDIRYLPEITIYFRHNTASVSTANLECQSINTLYVQYLLLSHLHDLPALSYEDVRDHLARDVDKPRLLCREEMRRANIFYSQNYYWKGCRHLAKAVRAHPLYFIGRVLYELRRSEAVFNGEDPQKFLEQCDVLWPETGDSTARVNSTIAISSNTKRVECA